MGSARKSRLPGPKLDASLRTLLGCWAACALVLLYVGSDSEAIDDRDRSELVVGALTRFCVGRASSDP